MSYQNEGYNSTHSLNKISPSDDDIERDTRVRKDENRHEIIKLADLNDTNHVVVKNVKSNEESSQVQDNAENKNNGDEDDDADDDEIDDESLKNETVVGVFIKDARKKLIDYLQKPIIKWIILVLVVIGYFIYYGFAMSYNNPFNFPSNLNSSEILDNYVFNGNKGLALFLLTVIVILMVLWDNVIVEYEFTSLCAPISQSAICSEKFEIVRRWVIIGAVLLGCIIYLAIDLKVYYNLVSLVGIMVIILFAVLASAHPSHIQWRTLVTGLIIQFLLGVFVMRIEFGYKFLRFLTDQVTTFLGYADEGSKIVFGEAYTDHYFAFKVMPVVVFFGAIVNLLYYWGTIQYIILKLAFIVNKLMGTSPTESVNAVANIFLGQTEAPLLIKPFLGKMTASEIFAVMVGGFASVSGSILAAYIGFKAPPNQLISATVMAAPASLAISKIMQPEIKKTKADWNTIKTFPKGSEANFFEAYASGAVAMVRNVAAIVANLIAFTALFKFFDSILVWLFSVVELENFGFSSILQYLFWPLAFVMGTASEDCGSIAKLIGIKIFVNELVAYETMGTGISFLNEIRANGTYELYKNGTLGVPSDITMIWNDRSISIGTYALCGFANVASIGMQIGCLSALEPKKAKIFPKLALKAMIAGNMASFLNACIAGLLFNKL